MVRRLALAALLGTAIGVPAAVVAMAEGALHIAWRISPSPQAAAQLAAAGDAHWQSTEIQAADGIPLSAWWLVPAQWNGSAVLLLHGVADTRPGMSERARFLLRGGYAVLMPDSRGHGASGGDMITYGVREAGDVHRWVAWAAARSQRVFAIGRSMGAGILLQALPGETRLRAVIAECPFANFADIADYRVAQVTRAPWWAAGPFASAAFTYTRWHYDVDLRRASPEEAIRHTRTPVLLIHGDRDTNIPPSHSERLHRANPATQLWIVPGAGHVESVAVNPAEYEQRVLKFFRQCCLFHQS